ncbi:MAG: hypothetical protein AB7H43_05145 [Acidimicrobiia bacterium]
MSSSGLVEQASLVPASVAEDLIAAAEARLAGLGARLAELEDAATEAVAPTALPRSGVGRSEADADLASLLEQVLDANAVRAREVVGAARAEAAACLLDARAQAEALVDCARDELAAALLARGGVAASLVDIPALAARLARPARATAPPEAAAPSPDGPESTAPRSSPVDPERPAGASAAATDVSGGPAEVRADPGSLPPQGRETPAGPARARRSAVEVLLPMAGLVATMALLVPWVR